MIHVSSEEVIAVISDLVDERGFYYVYTRLDGQKAPKCSCVNIEHDENGNLVPSCIVGQVLSRFIGAENVPESGSWYPTLMSLKHLIRFDPLAIAVLSTVQLSQDAGKSWGESLSDGIEFSSRFGDVWNFVNQYKENEA